MEDISNFSDNSKKINKKLKIGIDLDNTLIYIDNRWKLVDGVEKYLPALYEKFDFCLITARHNDGSANMIISIIENNLNVKFESITCTSGILNKSEIANKLNCLYLIDDVYSNLFDCHIYNIKGILFSTENDEQTENVIVKSNWKDIAEFLLNE